MILPFHKHAHLRVHAHGYLKLSKLPSTALCDELFLTLPEQELIQMGFLQWLFSNQHGWELSFHSAFTVSASSPHP